MTLAEWYKLSGILPTTPTTEVGAVSLCISADHKARNALWHLTDYRVSSSCGVVIWLLPCQRTKAETYCPHCFGLMAS